jgi:cytochrome c553/mono/diheme cytochrome c family protein
LITRIQNLYLAVLTIGWIPAIAPAADEPTGIEFFEKKIRPALIQHCYECHSADAKAVKGGLLLDSRDGWKRGGDSGPALLPNKPNDSLLIKALKHEEGMEMPPKGKLSDDVIADFVKWIEQGAPDPRTAPAKAIARREIDIAAGQQFWCFQPITQPTIPAVKDKAWPSTNIDRFILAKQESSGIRPIGDAERATWLRRVTFDLIGLPPTPAEIDEFVSDPSLTAREEVVDRLLASPHFGERWGRHWLDIARFAESSGGGRSMILAEAWRYRDYVIRSLNDDKPFDRFLLEQLAGDLLPFDSPRQQEEQLVATALLALGPTNYEEQDKQALEFDVVDEQLETLGKAVLGMTIGCARCHDHKFDPIPQRDYYAMAGIFRSSHLLIHDNVSKWLERPLPMSVEQAAAVKQHDLAVADLKKQIDAAKAEEKQIAAANNKNATDDDLPGTPRGPIDIKAFAGIVLDDSNAKKVGEWSNSQFTKHYIGDGYSHDGNKDKGQKTLTFTPMVPKAGVYEVRLAYNASDSRATNVPVEILDLDGEHNLKINQRTPPPIDHRFVSLGKYRFDDSGQWYVLISNEGTDGHVIVDALQLLPVEEERGVRGEGRGKDKTTDKTQNTKDKLPDVKDLEKQLKELNERAPYRPMTMTIEEAKQIEETQIRIRGNVHSKGDKVPRGFLQVVSYGSPALPPAKESGRRELAAWLTSTTNPLTARVLANRIWHHLFGVGLVRTVDNFGSTGETPSHPELLDHLAMRLKSDGWSTKSLIREIVLSRTYGLASSGEWRAGSEESKTSTASALHSPLLTPHSTDPENRLLWRQNRRRHSAEAIRDAMLQTSDSLDRTMFGRTLRNPKQDGPNANIGEMTYVFDDSRRSVYTPILRNRLLELFEAFDFADPNLSIGRRNITTVPTQALYLMNSLFVMDQSREAARELLAQSDLTDEQRVIAAYRTTVGREPTPRERSLALRVVTPSTENTTPSPIAWERLFQALFASVDFRYLE